MRLIGAFSATIVARLNPTQSVVCRSKDSRHYKQNQKIFSYMRRKVVVDINVLISVVISCQRSLGFL